MLGTGVIYIFQHFNRKLIPTVDGRLDGIKVPVRVTKLKFSPDGKYLAAALGGGCGVRVWEVSSWRLVGSDDAGFAGKDEKAQAFCSSGTKEADSGALQEYANYDIIFPAKEKSQKIWFTVSGATGIRHYEKVPNGIAVLKFKRPEELGLQRPRGMALDAAKSRLAVGDTSAPAVAILDFDTLQPIGPKLLTVSDDLIEEKFRNAGDIYTQNVAWLSQAGKEWVFAGGYLSDRRLSAKGQERRLDPKSAHRATFTAYVNNIVRWDPKGDPARPQFFAFDNNGYVGIRSLRRARLLVAASNAIGMLSLKPSDANAATPSYLGFNRAIDIRFGLLDVSNDGKRLRIQNYTGSVTPSVFTFDLSGLTLTQYPVKTPYNAAGDPAKLAKGAELLGDKSYNAPDTPEDIVGSYATWSKRLEVSLPSFFGKKFDPNGALYSPNASNAGEISRSVAVTKDKNAVLWGTSNALRLVRRGASWSEVVCQEPLRYEALFVNLAVDDKLAIVSHSDGTIRWYRINQQETSCSFDLLLTLYAEELHSGRFEWALSMPSGYFYVTSPKGQSSANKLLGWLGVDKTGQPQISPLDKFYEKYFNKEVIQTALEKAALRKFVFEKSRAPSPSAVGITEVQVTDTAQIASDVKSAETNYRITLTDPKPVQLGDQEPLVAKVKFDAPPGPNFWPLDVNVSIEGQSVRKIYSNRVYQPRETVKILGPGEYEFVLSVPVNARQKNGPLTLAVNYRLDYQANAPFQQVIFNNYSWQGSLVPSIKRRVFAVLVGLSAYVQLPKLNYAHKDAIDIAKLLMNDFERINPTGEEFQALHITLLHAHSDSSFAPKALQSLRDQYARLNALSRVISYEDRPITPNGRGEVISALDHYLKDAGTPDEVGGQYQDTFIFYFSGHGVSFPSPDGRQNNAKNYLIMPAAGEYNTPQFWDQAMPVSDLGEWLGRTTAEKIIIIDACRSLTDGSQVQSSPAFQDSIVNALKAAGDSPYDVFVSADLGKESFGLSKSEFDQQYPDLYSGSFSALRGFGNGVFTNLLLESLFCKDSDFRGDRKIVPFGIANFFDRFFATKGDTFKALQVALKKRQIDDPPQPSILPYNNLRFNSWYRRLQADAKICLPPEAIATASLGIPSLR